MPEPIKTICIIPARGGSKGLPGKNIADLGGKPLLAYTIDAALNASLIERVIVSTDYQDIAEVGKQFGAEVPFLRPASLSTDTAHSPDVVQHAVEFIEKKEGVSFDVVIMAQPTSPYRTGQHFDAAIELFLKTKPDSLISIKPQDYPPWWMFKIEHGRISPAVHYRDDVNVFNLERQEFPKVYRPNGAIYVTWRDYLRTSGNIVNQESCGYYLMDELDSVDIDLPIDLATANVLFPQWQQRHNISD